MNTDQIIILLTFGGLIFWLIFMNKRNYQFIEKNNMSNNTYILVHKIGKKYYIWNNLNAERAVVNKTLTTKNADISFDTMEEAVKWANKNDDTEYGYQIDNPYKPKDGYREKLLVY